LIVFSITPGSHPGLFTFDPFRVGCIELQVVAAPGVCAVVRRLWVPRLSGICNSAFLWCSTNQNLFFIALSPNVFFELRVVRSALLRSFRNPGVDTPGYSQSAPDRAGCIEL